MAERKKKKGLLLCQAKEATASFEDCFNSSLGRIAGSFIVKRRRTGFQIGIRIGADMHSSFFGGIVVIDAGVRRSWPDLDGGLLGYCLE